jgi:hypothetical protein
MSNNINVPSVARLLETGKTQEKIYDVQAPRKGKDGKIKTFNGSFFGDTKLILNGNKSDPFFSWVAPTTTLENGSSVTQGIRLRRGLADPNKPAAEEKRNGYNGSMYWQIEIYIGSAGALGEYAMRIHKEWKAGADALIKSGAVDSEGKMIHPFVDTHYPREHPTTPKGPREEGKEILHMKIDPLKCYPDAHPIKALAGKAKTIILDYEKPYTTADGKTDFRPATVVNDDGVEEPLSKENAWKFINNGAQVMALRCYHGSYSVSDKWISNPVEVLRVVVKTGRASGEMEDEEQLAAPEMVLPATAAVAPAVTSPAVTSAASTASTTPAAPVAVVASPPKSTVAPVADSTPEPASVSDVDDALMTELGI